MTAATTTSRRTRFMDWARALDAAFDRDPVGDQVARLSDRVGRLEARLGRIETGETDRNGTT